MSGACLITAHRDLELDAFVVCHLSKERSHPIHLRRHLLPEPVDELGLAVRVHSAKLVELCCTEGRLARARIGNDVDELQVKTGDVLLGLVFRDILAEDFYCTGMCLCANLLSQAASLCRGQFRHRVTVPLSN